MPAPLLVVALDSADPDLLLQWSQDGTLPILSALRASGAYARLTGPETVSAHGVWTSIWSGVSMSRHGRYLRRALRSGTYDIETIDPAPDTAPHFWSALTSRKIAVIDAPDARLVPGLRGPQLLGWGGQPSPLSVQSEPRDLGPEIERRAGGRILSDETQGGRARDRRVLGELLERVRRQGVIARHLLEGCDGAVVGFGDAHAAGHRFWKYGPRAAQPVSDETLSDALKLVYVALDEEIGHIAAALGSDTHVVVVSNHGIRDGYPTESLMRAFCHHLGYQVSRRRASRSRALSAAWHRVAARLGARAQGDLQNELESTDWGRTTVFAIPGLYTGFLRVNLRGREPRGIVDRRDYTATLDRVEADLRQVVEGGTGAPAVERITRSADAFGGGIPDQLPDLIVEWRLASSPHVRHPRGTLQGRGFGVPRANLHSRAGLLFGAGPTIRARGDAGELSPTDLAPLFLCLAGDLPPDAAQPAIRAFGVTQPS